MPQTRNVSEVLDRVLAAVPIAETALRARLKAIKEDSWFQPPESRMPWDRMREALEGHFGGRAPAEPWGLTVSLIVRGQL